MKPNISIKYRFFSLDKLSKIPLLLPKFSRTKNPERTQNSINSQGIETHNGSIVGWAIIEPPSEWRLRGFHFRYERQQYGYHNWPNPPAIKHLWWPSTKGLWWGVRLDLCVPREGVTQDPMMTSRVCTNCSFWVTDDRMARRARID